MTGTRRIAFGVNGNGDKSAACADDRFARRRILTARKRESLRSQGDGYRKKKGDQSRHAAG
jgi:hypothetical protein